MKPMLKNARKEKQASENKDERQSGIRHCSVTSMPSTTVGARNFDWEEPKMKNFGTLFW